MGEVEGQILQLQSAKTHTNQADSRDSNQAVSLYNVLDLSIIFIEISYGKTQLVAIVKVLLPGVGTTMPV